MAWLFRNTAAIRSSSSATSMVEGSNRFDFTLVIPIGEPVNQRHESTWK
jgi:hypothetical protein